MKEKNKKQGQEKNSKALQKQQNQLKNLKKNDKVDSSSSKKQEKAKKSKSSLVWLMSIAVLCVALLLFCQFFYGDNLTENSVFYNNTQINGVDVSGMTKSEAKAVIQDKMLANKDEISLTLTDGSQEWTLNGSDFEVKGDIEEEISRVMSYGRTGNIFAKKKVANDIKKNGLDVNISYKNILGGVEQKLEDIIAQVEQKAIASNIVFNPDQSQMFTLSDSQTGKLVDRDQLHDLIDQSLETFSGRVEIPFVEVMPEVDMQGLIEQIGLRSSFSTNYSTSSIDRKTNVKKALSAFNGMVVEPNETVSFNKTTGPRTVENGYKKANIIVGGVYVSGAGGGVCQASTTLYNALLLADMEIIEVNHHSLPASYVPLSFDAMVSEGYSDLVFKNSSNNAIYIKAYGDENEAHVEIYGLPIDDGVTIRTRAELVKVLGHSGDKIISDTSGEYSNHVLYKGEYYRVKFPREGYESKGYIQYLKDGEVVEEKLVRHDHYASQGGIIVEGTESIGEGMALPTSNVNFIPPQKVTKQTTESVKNKLEKTNPSAYNP